MAAKISHKIKGVDKRINTNLVKMYHLSQDGISLWNDFTQLIKSTQQA